MKEIYFERNPCKGKFCYKEKEKEKAKKNVRRIEMVDHCIFRNKEVGCPTQPLAPSNLIQF